MRFVVSSTALLSHLQAISKVINSKNTLPILDCFLLELEGSTLSLTAADSETRLVTSLEVNEADGNGKFAVNAKNLLDPLKELPDQPLTFEINSDNLETFIFFHNGKYNFIGQNGEDYPQPKQLKETAVSLTIEPQVLFSGINRTLFASADDELRPVMNGVYFDISTEDLTFVASDGHKLVRCKTLSAKGAERASFILPKKPANLLRAILPKESETVEIKFD
ncbi:MAG: DNA polymerase III subunit beta, partial [Dysgonomonas mossii]|nr:DNA polymerase III subunit beta [Dysgonomonas mossii]